MRRKKKKTGVHHSKIYRWFKKLGTLDVVLIFMFVFFMWFNGQMLAIYKSKGSMPETYACAVIAATIGECGICGWIRTTKDKKRDFEQERKLKKDMTDQDIASADFTEESEDSEDGCDKDNSDSD